MATLRKLQQEIDKTLKKVAEGLEEFDTTFEQMSATENTNTKDKYESNLKSELKKLQKYREQIKAWIGNSDVKDTSELQEVKRDIERRMEGFKAFEKESKLKAYSKEGLQAAHVKLDPKERAKQEVREWLNSTVETLSSQVEEMEAEVEDINGGKNKKKSKATPRLSLLEDGIERHQLHIGRLEQILRLVDNDVVSIEEVEDIRDLIDDYIERSMESPDDFINPDDIYMDLIDILDSQQDTTVSHLNKEKSMSAKDKEREREKEREEKEREKQKAAAAAAKALLAAQGNLRLVSDDSVSAPAKAASLTPAKPVPPAPAAPAIPPPPPPPPPPAGSKKGTDSSPMSPVSGSAASAPGTPVHAFAAVASAGARSSDPFPALGIPNKEPEQSTYGQTGDFSPVIDDAKLDSGLDMLMEQMEKMQIQDSKPEMSPQQRLQMLQVSAPRSIPQLSDSRWSLLSQRPTPSSIPPPPSYPSQKLQLFEAPMFFDTLDVESLMFAFYFQPASMQQFLAARSLKNKSWNFNEETRRWYSLAESNPAIATKIRQSGGDTPQVMGQYVYFDPFVTQSSDGNTPAAGWTFRSN